MKQSEGSNTIILKFKDLRQSLKSGDENLIYEKISSLLIEYYNQTEDSDEFQLTFLGLPLDTELLNKLKKVKKHEIWETKVSEQAKFYLESFLDPKLPFREKKQNLDKALRILIDIYSEKKENTRFETLVLIAKTYLLRSKLILPKGFSFPAKKLEAIKKGIEFINLAISKNNSDINAIKLRAELYIENLRINPGIVETEEFEKALSSVYNFITFISDSTDAKIIFYYCKLSKKTDKLTLIVNSDVKGIDIEKARAFILLENEDKFEESFDHAISKLRDKFFFDPLWDDAVELLIEARDKKFKCWEKFAIKLWEICNELEEGVKMPFYIRWYWARMKPLYDLTYLASGNNFDLKIKVADSIKNRAVLRFSQILSMVWDNDVIESLYDEYVKVYSDSYVNNFEKLRNSLNLYENKTTFKEIDFKPDWIYVIFYISNIENCGYAIIIDGVIKEEKKFDFNSLFKSYLNWYKNYQTSKINDEKIFKEFFEELGKIFDFLFNFKEGKKILFVPHGFLHRIPIHAALRKNEFLISRNYCQYLPSFNLESQLNQIPYNTSRHRILLKNFKEYEFTDLIKEGNFDEIIDNAEPKHLSRGLNNQEIIVILSHGIADVSNPFFSQLELHKGNLRIIDILKEKELKINNSTVIIGACESDLYPAIENPIDEFISLSSSLLYRGCLRTIGAMWEVLPNTIEEMILDVLNSQDYTNNTLWNWQKNKINAKEINSEVLSALAIRVLGKTV